MRNNVRSKECGKMKNRTPVPSLALLLVACVASAQPAARSTSSRVLSAKQAKNGERVYQAQCASFHGADPHSTEPDAPDLTDGAFKFGKSRSLDDETYVDIDA